MSSHNKYTDLALANDAPEVVNAKGKNVISPPEKEPLWKRYFDKFKDPLIYILFIALVLSVVLVGYQLLWLHTGGLDLLFEPIGILVAILLSTGIGFYVELKAEKEFEVLNTVNDSEQVKVFRKLKAAGTKVLMLRMINIPKMDVVKGDIVRVESGDAIPADGILLESNQLLVDESAFTGEPFVRKNANDDALLEHEPNGQYNDNHSHAYAENTVLRGSTVIEGNGIYQVTATGFDTEEGKGAISTQKGREVRTPLNRQLDGLGKWISWLSIGLGILVLGARVVHYFYFANIDDLYFTDVEKMAYVVESVMIAVTLVVAAVPEGLPMSITMSLALSMRRLLKENNLVRRLHACETMGATTVICTDKTGTLTQNKMTVMDSLIPESVLPLVQMNIAVNSTATLNIDNSGNLISLGNPTEGALLRWLEATNPGEDTQFRYQMMRSDVEILEQVPFSTETKKMQTKVVSSFKFQVSNKAAETLNLKPETSLIKGAPEVLLASCKSFAEGLNKELVEKTLSEYQSKARRTLAFAANDVFLGIVGIADPIREDVPEAIRICKEDAHVKVIIVTGDNPGTAMEIGRQIGIMDDGLGILTGGEFAAMPDAELMPLLKEYKIKIIARAKPEDKARLVRLLQRNNEVVAVTGDGTNDAPALSKAHVGLSMGDGTARAKEASDITIIDNSFASINRAILWGRSIYKNIRRFIVFQTIVNVSACFIVLFGAFVGLDAPLNVTQMLWVNLIMDTFAALALSTIPPDKNVMYEKPRSWRAHIINRKTALYIFTYGTLFSLFLGAVWFLLVHNNHEPFLSLGEHGFFFSVFVFMQMWNLFNVRYFDTNRSIVRDVIAASKGLLNWEDVFNKTFMFIAAVVFFGQIVIVEFGKDFFGVNDLNTKEWLIAFAATSLVVVIPEILRTLRSKA